MTEYTLTLNLDQALEINKAVELLMRLKLGQSFTFCDSICGWDSPADYSKINKQVKIALEDLLSYKKDTEYKDNEWYRLYNIYQTVRYAIHQAEHPEGKGVDSYPPMRHTDEPLPKVEWRKCDDT